MKRLILSALAGICAVSCIYPFTPDIPGEVGSNMVISGSVLVGEESVITLGYLFPLSATVAEMQSKTPSGKVWIEGSDGSSYLASMTEKGKYVADTKAASATCRYKLHVLADGSGKEYITPWMDVQSAPAITDMSYRVDDSEVRVQLSMDSGSDSPYFRWDYEEVWEYHSDFVAELMFVPDVAKRYEEDPAKIYRLPGENENWYYCWTTVRSTQPAIARTDDKVENRIVGNEFLKIKRTDKRLQKLYSVKVIARNLSSDAYTYYDNLINVSNNTGSLFSPVPSNVRGNVRCASDSTEMVYGYVDAAKTSSLRFFIDCIKEGLYIPESGLESYLYYPQPDEDGMYNFKSQYNLGNAPVRVNVQDASPSRTNVLWAPKRCTDCRLGGGNKNKPSWWPNSDI